METVIGSWWYWRGFYRQLSNTHAEISCKALDPGKHVFYGKNGCNLLMRKGCFNCKRSSWTGQHALPSASPHAGKLTQSPRLQRNMKSLQGRVVCSNVPDTVPDFQGSVEFSGQQIMPGNLGWNHQHFLGEYQQLSADFSIPIKTMEGEDNVVEWKFHGGDH